MKILPRYILQEYQGNLILGLLIFTFVLLLDHLFELVDLLLNKGVGFVLTTQLLGLLLPSTLTLTLPVAHLLAALLTFGHFSETNEVTAVRASGLSAWTFLRIPILAAAASILFLIPFNHQWAPQAHARFRKLYVRVLERNPLVRIDEKTFAEIGEYHLYVEKKGRKSSVLRGVTVYRTPNSGASLRIFAENGVASVDRQRGIQLALRDGHIEQIDPRKPNRWLRTSFKNYVMFIPFEDQKQGNTRSLQEMPTNELQKEIRTLRGKGLPYPVFACEKYLRWSLAVSPVLFILLGVPLGIQVKRGGRSIGFGLSLLVLLIYYVLLMGGMSAGLRGLWPPILAVSLGNLLLTIVGGWLTLRLVRI